MDIKNWINQLIDIYNKPETRVVYNARSGLSKGMGMGR